MKPLKFVALLIALFALIMLGCLIKVSAQGLQGYEKSTQVQSAKYVIKDGKCATHIGLFVQADSSLVLPFKSPAQYDLWVSHQQVDTAQMKCAKYIDVLIKYGNKEREMTYAQFRRLRFDQPRYKPSNYVDKNN